MEHKHLTTSNNIKQQPQIFAVNVIDANDESSNADHYELESLSPPIKRRYKWGVDLRSDGNSSRDFLMPQTAAAMAPNGSVSFKMKGNSMSESTLNLKDNNNEINEGDKWEGKSNAAAFGSRVSLTSTLSALIANVDDQALQDVTTEDPEDQDGSAGSQGSGTADQYIKDAIPYLPLPVAVLFLLMNIACPGSGTILSGLSVFFCGKTRVQSKDDSYGTTCCVNVSVGLSQMLTVTFMLVGWFWSVVWGIYMVILSVEQRKNAQLHEQKTKQADAVTAMNPNIRPWSLKT